MMHSEYKWLDRIDSPDDLKKLSGSDLRQYCDELRQYIIEQCSSNPGHLASSLGAVELAVALHYVFDTPDDKIVWDVGHQTYAHKIITGRRVRSGTGRCRCRQWTVGESRFVCRRVVRDRSFRSSVSGGDGRIPGGLPIIVGK